MKIFKLILALLLRVLLICWSDMSCFQGLFFWPEAASMLLHNFCIYHICPPGHEVCNLVHLNFYILNDYFILHSMAGHHYSQSFLSRIFIRVLAVGSCSNLSRWSCSFCQWLGWSDPWGSQLLWVWCFDTIHKELKIYMELFFGWQ